MSYTIESVKTSPRTTIASLAEAVAAARAIDAEYQPAHGVTVSRGDALLATVDGGLHLEQVLLDRIEALRTEAEAAGDEAMAQLCIDALEDESDDALHRVLDALTDAEAQE